jgi:hypothetical protein
MEKLHCPFCNTVIRRSSAYVHECPVFARHLDRCERATERERAFYRAHRRWPAPMKSVRAAPLPLS